MVNLQAYSEKKKKKKLSDLSLNCLQLMELMVTLASHYFYFYLL